MGRNLGGRGERLTSFGRLARVTTKHGTKEYHPRTFLENPSRSRARARAHTLARGNFIIPGDKVGLYEAIVPSEARSSRCQTVYLFCVFTPQEGGSRGYSRDAATRRDAPRRLALSACSEYQIVIRLKEEPA